MPKSECQSKETLSSGLRRRRSRGQAFLNRSLCTASGMHQAPHDWCLPKRRGPSLGTTQPTTTITGTVESTACCFHPPPQRARTIARAATPPIRKKGPELVAHSHWKGSPNELAPECFVSQNYETLVQPHASGNKMSSSQRYRPDLTSNLIRPWKTWTGASAFTIGWESRCSRRLGTRRPLSESPPGSGLRGQSAQEADEQIREDEDMSLPWHRQKVDAFTRLISDFSEDKRRRMPANVKTYDGTVRKTSGTGSETYHAEALMVLKSCGGHSLNFTQREEVCKKPCPSSQAGSRRRGTADQATQNKQSQEQYRCNHTMSKQSPQTATAVRGAAGERQVHPTDNDPKGDTRNRGSNFQKTTPMRIPEEQRVGNWILRSWQRKTKQKVSQNFSQGSTISFPTLTTDNVVVEPLTIEINAAGHDIHRMYIDGGASEDILQHATKVTNLKVAIHPDYPEQEVSIGGSLSDTGRAAVCALLQRNLDIFAWEPKHMTGVPRSITEHKLKIRQGYSPVRQKKRGQAPERAKAILEEVHKLVEAGIMREVYYHDWLSNPVMVKKSDGSWRMCVDFTDLNKACPQDCYPLPEIDWKVESLCGYPFKCFLDAYKGYHQIQMAKDDEEKTAFHTSQGVYCYTKMPFGLKNAGATYQRLVDNAFEGQVGRNLEVYVDDLVIKSHTEDELVRDIVETFRALRQINMKLNPKKCTFGATEGMFLGYLIETDGIKPCPEKTKAVIQLPSPRTMKEVQSLNGKLAGLNRFLSKSADKSLPLFKTLKKCAKKGDFRWTTEAEEAFTQLKQHIAALPTLVAPRPGEELIMYLSATHGAISAVLLTDRDSVQTPVYFVSKALKETEINYSAMEKLILALVFAAKRLRRYFQAHPVAVITDQPIKQVISKPDASGRLQKWSVLLGEHNISYRPRTAVKGQILADFLIEKPETDAVLPQSEVKLPEPWILFTDGSSCVDGSGAGLILTNPEGMEFTYALRFEFTATNNEAEYEALLAGLRIAARMGVRNLEANVDSRLVANHVLGEYVAKEDNMVQYLDKTKSLIQGFDRFTIRQVPRGDNKKADALSKIASTSFAHLSKQVLVEILKNKSISEMEISTVIEEQDPTWMTPIVEFISKGTLPHEQKDARRIRRTAQRFELRDGVLYRRSFLQPWLRCVGPIQADYVLREIHAGSCTTIDLDILEERREQAAIREAKAKLKMKGYYDAKVRGVSFRPGDFVYRANDASHAEDTGKLGPKWEGPYEVTKPLGKWSIQAA
ncbi:reverse transcriptase domain-containing protein [Tanacetum coccineum]